jgi:GNAT superfamily N-acetyltransferase
MADLGIHRVSRMKVRTLCSADSSWVESIVTRHFGSSRVVSRGVLHDALSLPGLVAELDSKPVGLLQYRLDRDLRECEVVILISEAPRRGIGRRLLEALRAIAGRAGCIRLWLITTNDNRSAIGFYRAMGWKQVAIHRGAVREARRLKPEIPELGEGGIPIEDEIEFELPLEGG